MKSIFRRHHGTAPHTMPPGWRPVRTLLAIAFAGLLSCLAAVGFMCLQPWLGLELAADQGPGLQVLHIHDNSPASAMQGAVRLLQLALPDGLQALDLQAQDLTGDPDELLDYGQVDRFIARQEHLAALLRQGSLQVVWMDGQGMQHSSRITPLPRPLSALPFMFWFELVCAQGGLMISGWVLALRVRDVAARLFAITGLCTFAAILVQSLYGNRELAIGNLRYLDALNHATVFAFGCALLNLFLCYPKPLLRLRHLLWPWLVTVPWWMLDTWRLLPSQNWGLNLPLITYMVLATLLAARRWRLSHRQPLERAALRWFFLSFMLACWLFVFTTVGPIALGLPSLIPVGYAAGFLLLIYVGLALGITRYRLFELNVWAYRIALTVAGAVLVAALDMLLIWALQLDALVSLGWAVFLTGWIYFPLRQWLWQRLAGQSSARVEETLPELMAIAFNASAEGREQQWLALLQKLFAPLELLAQGATPLRATIAADGLGLLVPAVAGLQARELRYASKGRRLFNLADVQFVQGLCELMGRTAASRDAYERGAAEERSRVYRDLHDDIGAKLLSLAIGAETPARADLARSALHDLRDVVSHGGRGPMPLSALLANWRAEMDMRLGAAGLQLQWQQALDMPDPSVDTGAALHLGRILREATSNVLRHAHASALQVQVDCDRDWLRLLLRDDGRGMARTPLRPGKGLANMQRRAELLGGSIRWQDLAPQGCELSVVVSCTRLAEAPELSDTTRSGGTPAAQEPLA